MNLARVLKMGGVVAAALVLLVSAACAGEKTPGSAASAAADSLPAGPTVSDGASAGMVGAGQTSSTQPIPEAEPVSGELVVYSGRSEPLIQPVLAQFQAAHPEVKVLLKTGKNGDLANALLEERANPQADVFLTTEMVTIQALAQQGVLAPYAPPGAASLPAQFRGKDDLWTGLTLRARVIMYNSELVPADQVPQSVFELTDPTWKGKVAAADSTNGSMVAHIAALRQLLGDAAAADWVRGLVANGTVFFGGHTDVRKAVAAGEFALGLVNHYYYHLQKAEGGPVGVVYPDQGPGQIGLITNATAVALVEGAKNRPAAQAFVDFLLSPPGQELFARLNYEYPLVPGVALHPEVAPLSAFRLADVDVAAAALDLEGTLALIEAAGMK